LFQCAYPLLTGKPAKIAGSLLTAALKYVKFDTGAITAENVFGFSADVYVFDDLERYEGVKNPTPRRSYIQRSPEQRSPDRQASFLRRRRMADTGPLPGAKSQL
jgi:hypothetical protein